MLKLMGKIIFKFNAKIFFFYPNLYLSFFALSVLEDRLCPHGQYRHSVASPRALSYSIEKVIF